MPSMLSSPRRLQSGHFTCYLIRTYHVLTTLITLSLDIRLFFAYAARMAITRRQHELYDFLSRFVQEKGYSPSFEEIKDAMGLSSLATVHKHVTRSEEHT